MKYGLKTLIVRANCLLNGQPKQLGIRETFRKMQLFCDDMTKAGPEFGKWMDGVLKETRAIRSDGGWSCENVQRFQKFYLLRENELRALALEATKGYDNVLIEAFKNCVEKIRPELGVGLKDLDDRGSRFKSEPNGYTVNVSPSFNSSDQVSPSMCWGIKLAAFVFLDSPIFAMEFEKAMCVYVKLADAAKDGFDTSVFFKSAGSEHMADKRELMLSVYMHARDHTDMRPFDPKERRKAETPIVRAKPEKRVENMAPVAQTKRKQEFYPSLDKNCKTEFGFDEFKPRKEPDGQ